MIESGLETREQVAEIEAAWEQEIADRVADYERGEPETFAAAEVFAEARRLAWRRAAELREATRGRKVTPSEELIWEDRDRDHSEGNR